MTLELAAARKDEQVHAEARAVAEERAARAEAGKDTRNSHHCTTGVQRDSSLTG